MKTVDVDDEPAGRSDLLVSVTACPDEGTRCTIYASESPHSHRAARWMSASGASFVALDDMR